MSALKPTRAELRTMLKPCPWCFAKAGAWCVAKRRPRDAIVPKFTEPGVVVIPRLHITHRFAEYLHRSRDT